MRYICKACGRKRNQELLFPIGKAHNNFNVWLCRDGDSFYNACEPEKWKEVKLSFMSQKDLDRNEQLKKLGLTPRF